MDDKVFDRFRQIIHKTSGISLNPDKKTLLANRIRKRLRALKVKGESDYLEIIETDRSGEELAELLDAISTNLTYFFREKAHFESLAQILTDYKNQNRSEVKIWCAASSSGEEPYTLAMLAHEYLDLRTCQVRILATDICSRVLRTAVQGTYAAEQLREAPANYVEKYFKQVESDGRTHYRINPEVAALVLFKKLNLAQFPYPLKGPLDLIFCRNVMIYFENDLRERLIRNFYQLLRPGGHLFVGHSESLSSIKNEFKVVQTSVYCK